MKAKLAQLVAAFVSNLSFLLAIASAASFVYAGFIVNQIVGFVVLGIVLILLAYVLSPSVTGGVN